MIIGHGIDMEDLAAIAKVVEEKPRFASKVLRPAELAVYESLSPRRQLEYLGGRWTAKEAFAKAWGTGIGAGLLRFQDLEILNRENGAPYFSKAPFAGNIWISISHTKTMVQASVILEEVSHENESPSAD
ncbi:holo-ACP synthase [Streptococcus danieliae]|uniref:Holo-[acyl-carrier-protein] synthase n=1 Tax=Streptococcus danieliae TaxID=747656 RepID=A0A7Z0LC82_9STRE|nr:holo-ACP synthase [Streptococcus danieliae]MBF0716832.1 holo-ACP synthase [Streptococcus danieliae]NYS48762.1 holo-ACP synthase [Streptococcus danieliae]